MTRAFEPLSGRERSVRAQRRRSSHNSARQIIASADRAMVSDWGLAELSSALRRAVRMGRITVAEAALLDHGVDVDVAEAGFVPVESRDIMTARRLVQNSISALRTPDALNLAVAQRLELTLLTFDGALADAAREIGHSVVGA